MHILHIKFNFFKSLSQKWAFYSFLSISIGVLVSFMGCTPTYKNEQQLISYVNDPQNGLLQNRKVNNTDISVFVRPSDLLLAQEMKFSESSPVSIDSLRAEYNAKLYFILSMRHNGDELENQFLYDRNLYEKAVAYTSAGMQEDIAALVGKDTIHPIGYIYPRMYGSTERNDILIVFQRDKLLQQESFQLLLKDRMFGLGIQQFVFEKDAILKTPSLQL